MFRGGSAAVISDNCPAKLLHCFDTFEGLPCEGERKGQYAFNFEDVKEYLKNKNVKFYKGFFPDTAPENVAFYSLVHLDGDIYESTLSALKYFWPRMVKNGIIVLDDLNQEPGVNQALEEFGLLKEIESPVPLQGILRKK